jgi:hypothetical protein
MTVWEIVFGSFSIVTGLVSAVSLLIARRANAQKAAAEARLAASTANRVDREAESTAVETMEDVLAIVRREARIRSEDSERKIAALQKQNAEQAGAMALQEGRITALQRQNGDQESRIQGLDVAHKECEVKNAALKSGHTTLSKQAELLSEQVNTQRGHIAKLEGEIDTLRRVVGEKAA